jgi:hypothetical protein
MVGRGYAAHTRYMRSTDHDADPTAAALSSVPRAISSAYSALVLIRQVDERSFLVLFGDNDPSLLSPNDEVGQGAGLFQYVSDDGGDQIQNLKITARCRWSLRTLLGVGVLSRGPVIDEGSLGCKGRGYKRRLNFNKVARI